MMTHEEISASFTLMMGFVKRFGSSRTSIAIVQDHWGVSDNRRAIRKADDEPDRSIAGEHGIPEIGRQERAFYDALSAGEQEAYRGITDMVSQLFAAGKGWGDFDPWSIDESIDAWKRSAFEALATHPMQAYLVGQMLATDALNALGDRSSTARPLMPTDKEAIDFLEHYTFNEVGSKFDEFKPVLRNLLIQAMQEGEHPDVVARNLRTAFDDYQRDYHLVAITETARAESQGRLAELADAGFTYAIGSSAHDTKTCDKCKEMIDGQVVVIADTIGVSNYGRKQKAWLACIPLHPRCRCVWLPKNVVK